MKIKMKKNIHDSQELPFPKMGINLSKNKDKKTQKKNATPNEYSDQMKKTRPYVQALTDSNRSLYFIKKLICF